MKANTLFNIIAHFFVFFFIYISLAKLMDVEASKQEMAALPYPGSVKSLIFWVPPVIQLLLVITLVIPAWRLVGLYSSLVLITLFTIYLAISMISDNGAYNYGGILEDLSPKQHILFNITCIFLAAIGIHSRTKQQHKDSIQLRWFNTTASVILFTLITWVTFTSATTPHSPKTGFEGRVLPSFQIVLEDGMTQLSTAQIPNGKPFMVIGFSPYCPHCRHEIKDILNNINQFRNTTIYLITSLPVADLKQFYTQFQLSKYPNVVAGTDNKNAFLSSFKIHMIPFTAVYNTHKRLEQAIRGRAEVTMLAKYLNR